MNTEFKGFTPQQTEVLARKMGYSGDMEGFATFLSENPELDGVFKGYEDKARNRFQKKRTFAAGGVVQSHGQTSAQNPNNPTVQSIPTLPSQVRDGEAYEVSQDMVNNPEHYAPTPQVEQQQVQQNELVDPNSGQVGPADQVNHTNVNEPTATAAPQIDATKTETDVKNATDGMEAEQGEVSQEAQAQAQTMDPQQMAQLGYTAEQIQQAQQVVNPGMRVLESGEAVSGSAVDMAAVEEATQVQAATADPSVKATVQGQLEGLMQQFEGGQTPPWAAGAMRAAQQQLIARGLGASSIAGQAVIQAAMESALPIAMADAQTHAAFEAQNLSNRQQAAMFGAEQRAKFLGMQFDQEFQSRVLNAAKISDIANMNFTAEQQIALENARMAQTVDLANLDARNAKLMADMAAMSQMEMQNLNNRQQSAVVNAQSFLQMDMANLDARQQAEMFKNQSIIQSLFTDAAADNAAKQFNATSQMQTDQFFANLQAQVSMFNSSQSLDADKFNSQMKSAQDQFNASNRLIIDQSNAQWRRQVSTANTAAINEANMFEAQAALGLTTAAYNNLMQVERDLYSFAYDSSEKALDRAAQIALAQLQARAGSKAAKGQALGALAGAVVNGIFSKF